MSLFDIKNKLYKKESTPEDFQHDVSQYDPSVKKAEIETPKEGDLWVEKKNNLGTSEKKTIRKGLMALGIILSIILIMLVVFEVRRMIFDSSSSSVEVSGPSQSNSGEIITYEIDYKNGNWVNMENVTLRIIYPEQFRPEEQENFKEDNRTSGTYDLGTLKAKSSGKVSFRGRAYSPKGALIYLKAELAYQPAGFSGQFDVTNQLGINIVPAPFLLEIEGPQKMAGGDAIDYVVTYQNEGNSAMDNLQLRLTYPEGFIFSKANPTVSENDNIWKIGNLNPGESGKIIISGKMNGKNGSIKLANASVGALKENEFISYNDESFSTEMIGSPLIISQTINDKQELNVNAGQVLLFKIAYKNTGNIGLRDVIVTEKLDGVMWDFSTLDMKGGKLDVSNNLISWKAADIKEFNNLGPGQSGEIIFSIKLKDNIPLTDDNQKNFIITSLSKIDSSDIYTPISSNKIISSNNMEMKINSKIILEGKGFYNDMTIVNTGPMPPRVGEETTYTIHWKVMNVSNDISNAQVSAVLPTNATMAGKFIPEDARLNYNERTNSLVWDIGKMEAGSGILSNPLELSFQIKIKPSPDQAGREVGLLGAATFSADDLFTGDHLVVFSEARTTDLYEDRELLKIGGNRVAK